MAATDEGTGEKIVDRKANTDTTEAAARKELKVPVGAL